MDSNHLKRIDTPPEVAGGPDDQAAYIVIRTRIKNKHVRPFREIAQQAVSLAELETVDEASLRDLPGPERKELFERLSDAAGKINKLAAEIFEAYTAIVVEWNWLDMESGKPLPPPCPDVFRDELDQIQINWLREQVQQLIRYRATEGNDSTSTP